MSEKGPKFNPFNEALDNFEADKKAHEEQLSREWAEKLKAEAFEDNGGQVTFDDEERAKQTLGELGEYYTGMEDLHERQKAENENREFTEEARQEGLVVPENDLYELRGEDPSRRESERRDMEQAFDDLLATEGNGKLRQMDRLSSEIEELQKLKDEGEADEDDLRHKEEKEDRLNELLAKYEESDDYIPAVADYMMDRSEESRQEAGLQATFARRERGAGKDKTEPTGKDDSTELPKSDNTKDLDPVKSDELDDDELWPAQSGELDIDGDLPPVNSGELDEDGELDPVLSGELDDAELEPVHSGELDGDHESLDPVRSGELDDSGDFDPTRGTWRDDPRNRLSMVFSNIREKIRNAEKKEKRKWLWVGIGGVALVGTAVWGAIALSKGLSSGGAGSMVPGDTGSTGASHNGLPFDGGIDMTNGNPPVEFADTTGFSEAARTAHEDEGWLNQLKEMGMSSQEAYDKLPKILESTDPGIKEWVYRMSDGNPGISHTGQIPQSVLESIENL